MQMARIESQSYQNAAFTDSGIRDERPDSASRVRLFECHAVMLNPDSPRPLKERHRVPFTS